MKTKNGNSEISRPAGPGFTLIELMIVLVIIGVFAAIAVPELVEVSRRNKLTDLANMVQQNAGMVRTYAMQTRHATVLEVADGLMWINVLDGPTCWSALRAEDRCMHNMGQTATTAGTNRFELGGAEYAEAGAAMCGAEMWFLVEGTCTATGDLGANPAFALCYSGEGDLFVRASADATGCDGPALALAGQQIAARGDWQRACYYQDGESGSSGAVMRFNRFEGSVAACDSSNALDVTRAVLVPIGAAPYGRVDL